MVSSEGIKGLDYWCCESAGIIYIERGGEVERRVSKPSPSILVGGWGDMVGEARIGIDREETAWISVV
jgi:hypothetical protein